MKDRKNKTQRQEVRRILAAMRQELQEHQLHYEDISSSRPVIHLDEVIARARNQAHRLETRRP